MFKNKKLGRERLLIVGCGDIGMRCITLLKERFRIFALTSDKNRMSHLRQQGATPILGNLDHPETLNRIRHLADKILHFAPPPACGNVDSRTPALLAKLAYPSRQRKILPHSFKQQTEVFRKTRVIYTSTSGVYGDCHGQWVDETHPVKPITARAKRRVSAEGFLRQFAKRASDIHTNRFIAILRVPGIYSESRLPEERLKKGLPILKSDEDVFTNHIHSEDLAKIAVSALFRAKPGRIYHAVDDSAMTMGEYMEKVADQLGLARPPRVPMTQIKTLLSEVQMSFLRESRRLSNRRLKQELRYRLIFPTIADSWKKSQ
ncbi:SDR family oxidoreductase [Ampullimonas aquatilis]|uniref:SDR family oxidoreductase n=1 Tax=Ampullimonas aquatilis TaxID=1341549 RepID=UPI003C774A6E